MKWLWLLSSVLSSTLSHAESFTCHSENPDRFSVSMEGSRDSWQSRNFLNYAITITENCKDKNHCPSPRQLNYKKLEERKEYKPYKYQGFQQYILGNTLNDSPESLGNLQVLVPENLNSSFEGIFLMSRPSESRGMTLKLNCQKGVSSPEPHSPREVFESFGINPEVLTYDQRLLSIYESYNDIEFQTALESALYIFLNDGNYSESPLNIAEFGVMEDWGLNLGTSRIRDFILPRVYLRNQFQNGKMNLADIEYPPEGGESYQENWIFELRLGISDHIFWAVIPKDQNKLPYVYGFN